MPETSLVRWMSMTSGRSVLRVEVVLSVDSVSGVVDWRSLARGWVEWSLESTEMSSAEASSSDELASLENFRRFRLDALFFDADGYAHSGTG